MASKRGWSQGRIATAVFAVGFLELPALLLLSIAAARMMGLSGTPMLLVRSVYNGIGNLTSHVSPVLVFIAAPVIAATGGLIALVLMWRTEVAVGVDAITAGELFRRRILMLLLALGTLAAGLIAATVISRIAT